MWVTAKVLEREIALCCLDLLLKPNLRAACRQSTINQSDATIATFDAATRHDAQQEQRIPTKAPSLAGAPRKAFGSSMHPTLADRLRVRTRQMPIRHPLCNSDPSSLADSAESNVLLSFSQTPLC